MPSIKPVLRIGALLRSKRGLFQTGKVGKIQEKLASGSLLAMKISGISTQEDARTYLPKEAFPKT